MRKTDSPTLAARPSRWALLVLLCAGAAGAVTRTWTGSGSNDFTSASNWSPPSSPSTADSLVFNSGSQPCSLTVNVSIGAIAMTSGYTGLFSFGAATLNVYSGTADFRSGGAINPGTGTLGFSGTSGSQPFTPKAGAVFPAITKSGAGTVVVKSNALTAGSFTLTAGTWDWGSSSLTHSVGDISATNSSAMIFGPNIVKVTGTVCNLFGLGSLTPGSGTLEFASGANLAFTPAPGMAHPFLRTTGSGQVTLGGNVDAAGADIGGAGLDIVSYTLSLTGNLQLSGGTLDAVNGALNVDGDVSAAAGTLSFPTGSFTVAGSFTASSATLTHNSGALILDGTSSGKIIDVVGTLNDVTLNGSGDWTIVNHGLTLDGTLAIGASSLNLGSSLTHSVAAFATAGSGSLDFGSSTLQVTSGNAGFYNLSTLTAGSGTLAFTAASGMQFLDPKPGATHPAIVHAAAGGVQLGAANLTCISLTNSAGTFDLGGRVLTVDGGDLSLTNGGAGSFTNIGSVMVSGNAFFSGISGTNRLVLNSGASWTLEVGGTLNGHFVSLGNSQATGVAGTCSDCVDLSGNANWAFGATWDGGGGVDHKWSTPANWVTDQIPQSNFDVTLDGTSSSNCVLDGDQAVHAVHLAGTYTGIFDFSGHTLTVTGDADFQSGGSITGAGLLQLAGATAQVFTPKAGAPFPDIRQNGAGGTTIGAVNLTAGNLTVATGTLHLGNNARSHSFASVSGTGNLDFGNSDLIAAGNVDLHQVGTISGTGNLILAGSLPQTLQPNGSANPKIKVQGSSTVTVISGGLSTPGLTLASGTLVLGTSLIHDVQTLAITGGNLDFGSATLRVSGAAADFTSVGTLTGGGGVLEFNGASAQTFTPKTGAPFPIVRHSGSGTTTIASHNLTAASLDIAGGTLNLGASLIHSIGSLTSFAGALDFNTSSLNIVSGDADFSHVGTLAAGSGNTLSFSGPGGKQTLTPLSSATLPVIVHASADTLRLAGALTCSGFTQSAGVFDFNGFDMTAAGGGNVTVTNGGATSLLGLGGRILTVSGAADFHGVAGTPLGLAPASTWTLAVTGAIGAVNADIKNCHATIHVGVADSSQNLGGNTNWIFQDHIQPADVTGFAATALASGHSVALAWTPSVSSDADSVMLRYRTNGAYPTDQNDGSLWRLVSNSTNHDTATGLSDKTLIHFAAFVKDTSGNWSPVTAAARDTALTPDVTPPANVTAFAAAALSKDSIALSWTPSASSDAESLMVRYRSDGTYPTGSTDGTLWKKRVAGANKDTVSGLTEKSYYHFAVFVKDTSGNWSGTAVGARGNARTFDVTSPAAVTAFAATGLASGAVAIAWTASASPDADSVMLRYRTNGAYPADRNDGTLWRIASNAVNHDTATGFAAKTLVHFAAFTKDTAGNWSPASSAARDTAFIPDVTPPANVTAFAAIALSKDSIALSWTPSASSDAESLMVRYRTDGISPTGASNGTLWKMRAASANKDTVTGLAEKTYYNFGVFVKDTSGNWCLPASGSSGRARTFDVTPPAPVTAFTATALGPNSVALAWTASASSDVDSVIIRYRTGLTFPSSRTDGTAWKTLPVSRVKDTVTGLSASVVYSFGAFARDSSANYAAAAASAQDTSLFQPGVSGTVSALDGKGAVNTANVRLSFTYSSADSLRFTLLADTGLAAWSPVHAADSVSLLSGGDGIKIVAAQFKNVFGKLSPWVRDTTRLDRVAPVIYVTSLTTYNYLQWPGFFFGKARDALSGTDTVFVTRRRDADGKYYNGSAWGGAFTQAIPSDSDFASPLPGADMTTGDYTFTAAALDKAGNASAQSILHAHYEEDRVPQIAYSAVSDSTAQNAPVDWLVDFGDLDAGDTLKIIAVSGAPWLTGAPSGDSGAGAFPAHLVYRYAGTPSQQNVGNDTLRVSVRDLGGRVFNYMKPLKVIDVNDPPRFDAGQDKLTVKEDSLTHWTPTFKDPDPLDKHTLTLIQGAPFAVLKGMSVDFNPGSRDVGSYLVRVVVDDGNLQDTLRVDLTVADVNDPPYAFPSLGYPSPGFWQEDRLDTFTVVVVDMDRGDPVSLVTALPAFITHTDSVDAVEGYNRFFKFAVKPRQGDTAAVDLALTFQDGSGAVSQLPLKGYVQSVDDPPLAVIKGVTTKAGAARVTLDVQDVDGSMAATRFHYRLMTAAGDTVRRGIDASPTLKLHPLSDGAYHLEVVAEDEGGAKQDKPSAVDFTISGATALALDSGRYYMIGTPGGPLPTASFGRGAIVTSWDEAGDDGSVLARYSTGKAVDSLRRGKGYWVRLAAPAALKAGPDLLKGPSAFRLTHAKQGWNQVANPYPYWVDLSASGFRFWEWDPDHRDLVDAHGLLKPWNAYWVMAARDTVLAVPDEPYFASTALPKSSGSYVDQENWSIQLSLEAGVYHDRYNFLGVRPQGRPAASAPASTSLSLAAATAELIPEPAKMGDYLALRFEKDNGNSLAYASDFRPALGADEEWWDFAVENSATGHARASLSPQGLNPLLASGLKVFLVRNGEAAPVDGETPLSLDLSDGASHYALVVTPHADFAQRLKGDFNISQNFPNPVTDITSFRFILPQIWLADGKRLQQPRRVRLEVFDYQGRLAARIAEGSFAAGAHLLTWKAAGPSGSPLARGSYVYRLETAGYAKTLKMIVK